jgi:hypothetical protein
VLAVAKNADQQSKGGPTIKNIPTDNLDLSFDVYNDTSKNVWLIAKLYPTKGDAKKGNFKKIAMDSSARLAKMVDGSYYGNDLSSDYNKDDLDSKAATFSFDLYSYNTADDSSSDLITTVYITPSDYSGNVYSICGTISNIGDDNLLLKKGDEGYSYFCGSEKSKKSKASKKSNRRR